MRRFMASWTRAMESATANTAKALWNLDASAMQQFHLASVRDADPYDEHLSELLRRDHLFRVESDVDVAARVQQLDASFRDSSRRSPREIGNRLIAPLTDVANARAFMSHFTWLGALPSERLVTFHDSENAERISRSLPFGSVLCGSTIGSGARCLVHVPSSATSMASRGRRTLQARSFSPSRTLRSCLRPTIRTRGEKDRIAKLADARERDRS
jgi:hypothetical protein